jgi:hypothetical protein
MGGIEEYSRFRLFFAYFKYFGIAQLIYVNVTAQCQQGLRFKDEHQFVLHRQGIQQGMIMIMRPIRVIGSSKSAWVSVVDANINVNVNDKSPVSVPVRPATVSPAATSTLASAFRFDDEPIIRAQTGLLVARPSLEAEGCLTSIGRGLRTSFFPFSFPFFQCLFKYLV